MSLNKTVFKVTNHVVNEQELLNRAHRVRTHTGDTYINHLNGLFYSLDGQHSLPLHDIYPIAVVVYSTNRRIIAKRKKLNRPLLSGVIVKKR